MVKFSLDRTIKKCWDPEAGYEESVRCLCGRKPLGEPHVVGVGKYHLDYQITSLIRCTKWAVEEDCLSQWFPRVF